MTNQKYVAVEQNVIWWSGSNFMFMQRNGSKIDLVSFSVLPTPVLIGMFVKKLLFIFLAHAVDRAENWKNNIMNIDGAMSSC